MASKDLVKQIIQEKFKLPRSLDLYKELLGKTQIEIYKEEDNVIKCLVKGDSKASIIDTLKQKYPSGTFSYDDLDKFIERSDELHAILKIDGRSLAKRWLKARADLAEELADIAFYTKAMIPELRSEGDNSNAIKAINTLNNLLMNVAQIKGLLGPETQVNTQINVDAGGLAEIKQKLQSKAHFAEFKINSDDKIPTDKKPESENKDTNSDSV
ncbi:MAG: hypothetical protein Q8O88_01410 [bacterium]|nr:hypothetical protein [bacterium]